MNLADICHAVTRLTSDVGQFILAERLSFQSSAIERKGHNDLVSYVDKEAESRLVEQLTELIPDAGFLTEENTKQVQGKSYCWIIDPLDGTTNFIHGIPCFCISIGLHYEGQPVLGVVHELNLNECFYAWKNGGAYLNGKKIRVSEVSVVSDSLIATGFPYHDYNRMKPYMEVFDHLMHHSHGLRRLGSAAADLAYTAAGRFEAFYEYGLNPWDVAAGVVLVQEAGGVVSDFSGTDNHTFGKEIIASNAKIYPEFLEIIQEKFGADR
jgi:myo-inositol-1(or 4)-monophosphatase